MVWAERKHSSKIEMLFVNLPICAMAGKKSPYTEHFEEFLC